MIKNDSRGVFHYFCCCRKQIVCTFMIRTKTMHTNMKQGTFFMDKKRCIYEKKGIKNVYIAKKSSNIVNNLPWKLLESIFLELQRCVICGKRLHYDLRYGVSEKMFWRALRGAILGMPVKSCINLANFDEFGPFFFSVHPFMML